MLSQIIPQKRILIFFNAIACVMLFIFALIIFQQAKKTEHYGDWVVHTYELLRIAHNLENDLFKVETAYRGYFLTGSKDFLVTVKPIEANIQTGLNRLNGFNIDNHGQNAAATKFQVLFQELKEIQQTHRNIYERRGSAALLIGDIQKDQQLIDQLQNKLEDFISAELKNLQIRLYLSKSEQADHMSTINIGAALSILGLVVANLIIILLMSKGAKTARRLEDIEAMHGLIQESIKDGLFDYDPSIKKIMFSPSYRRQLGYRDNELPDDLEKGFNNLIHPEDLQKVREEIDLYINKKIPKFSIAYRLLHADGSWVWMLSRAVGTWNTQGHCVRLLGVNTDITPQKKQEEALRELNNELESFTYIASHDLRSPLVNLKGFAREIENSLQEVKEIYHRITAPVPETKILKKTLENDIPESLNFINSAVERMDMLTGAILNLSRIGRRVYKPALVNMNDLVKRCLETLNYEITAHRAEVQVDVNLPEVYADPLAVEQLFSNIIENAVKYLAPDRDGKIAIQAKNGLSETIFSIADNGRGIRQEDSVKIFDIFRRARNTGDVRGVGMGLAFVRTTIRKMGGRIWYDSEPDKGTTFYIAIPKQQTES